MLNSELVCPFKFIIIKSLYLGFHFDLFLVFCSCLAFMQLKVISNEMALAKPLFGWFKDLWHRNLA